MFESYKIIENTDFYGATGFIPEFSSFLCFHSWKFIDKNGVIGQNPTVCPSFKEAKESIEKHKAKQAAKKTIIHHV